MTAAMAYALLGVSIFFELIASSTLTATKGFRVLKPSLVCIAGYFFSYLLFGFALLKIDLSIGYATWGAVGMMVTSAVGYFLYKQKLSKIGMAAMVLIIVSTVTLNLFG